MSNSEQRGHFIQKTPMVTAPHIASPGPAAEPCNVYTCGSIVARVSCVPDEVCKRRTASPRLCSCASPRSSESAGGLCGAHATFVGPTLPASGPPSDLEIYWHVDTDAHRSVPDPASREHCLFEVAAGLAREGVMGGGEDLDSRVRHGEGSVDDSCRLQDASHCALRPIERSTSRTRWRQVLWPLPPSSRLR